MSANEYDSVIRSPYHIYNVAGFNVLNNFKADEVFYLLFRDDKVRLGIIVGVQNKVLKSPFSAPFGGFSFISDGIRIHYIEDSILKLSEWAFSRSFSSIEIILPPAFYHHSFIAKQINCLWRKGYKFSAVELNFSFNICKIGESYHEIIWRNARKNLRISLEVNLQFEIALDDLQREIGYDVIARNRNHRGFPLRMTWEQVKQTTKVIPADFFLVNYSQNMPIAAAIVFHITEKIVQVIYWGDIPGYSELKPMNFLSFKLFEFYKSLGKEYIDVGHSTENSIPNQGLCEFKESLGCSINPRYTMTRTFS